MTSLKKLPDLPEPVYGHTLTHLGDGVVLQLGGVGSTKALTVNTSAENPQWVEMEGMSFFNNKSYFTSVKVGNQPSPWIVLDSKLHKIGPSGAIETIQLPFNVTTGHCAVANDDHMYIIGAGPNRDEIWLNLDNRAPYNFVLVNYLPTGRRHHRCIWSGTEILVVGGYVEIKYRTRPSHTIDVIDTLTGQIKKIGKLKQSRASHGMGIFFQEKITAFAGETRKLAEPFILNTTETYDPFSDKEHQFKLEETSSPLNIPIHSFGFVQFDP